MAKFKPDVKDEADKEADKEADQGAGGLDLTLVGTRILSLSGPGEEWQSQVILDL